MNANCGRPPEPVWPTGRYAHGHRIVAVELEQERLVACNETQIVGAAVLNDRVYGVAGDHAEAARAVLDEYIPSHSCISRRGTSSGTSPVRPGRPAIRRRAAGSTATRTGARRRRSLLACRRTSPIQTSSFRDRLLGRSDPAKLSRTRWRSCEIWWNIAACASEAIASGRPSTRRRRFIHPRQDP